MTSGEFEFDESLNESYVNYLEEFNTSCSFKKKLI